MFFIGNLQLRGRLALAAALIALLPQLPAQTNTSGKPTQRAMTAADRQQLQSALAAEDAGQKQQAESALRSLAARYPDNFDVIESMGLLYAEAGNFESAFPFLERAHRLSPASPVASANLGAVYLKLNRNEDAVKALERAANLEPRNAQTQANLGLALMQTNQPQRAAQAFAAAAETNSQDPDLLYNWSVALLAAGEPARASEVLARAPNRDSSPQVQSLMGEIAEKSNLYKDAVEHYQAAVNLDPSETNLFNLGLEFLRHWTFDPAIKIFDYGVTRFPDSARLLSGQGITRYANNDYAGAAQIFSRLLAKDPDNGFYAELLGHSCSLMPDSIEGCSSLVGFAERHPHNAAAATYAAASILHRPAASDNLALAQRLLDQAIAADPKLSDAYYQKGILEQQQERWAESVNTLERAIALKPEFSKAHYRLALAYSHAGQRDKAQEQIALQQRYSQQEKDELNTRLKEVTTFLVSNH